MGLFDRQAQAFDPSTYGGDGSLIDRIMANLQAQAGYQPSPMDANAAMQPAQAPAQQNAPIAVGSYQMPRIGGGFLSDYPQHDPQTGETIVQAQPQAAPQQASAPPTPNQHLAGALQDLAQSAPASIGNIFAKGADALQSMAHGGTLLASLRGQPDDPISIAQRQQTQQVQQRFEAYKAAGIPVNKAMLAAIDEDARKKIVDDAFGRDQFEVKQVGQDGLGRQTYSLFNKGTGELKPIAAPGGNDAAGGGIGDMNLSGKDYLNSIPPQQRGTVQGMVEGTIPPPSSFALSKPYWQNMIAAAKNVDPTFDAAQWSGRVAGIRDFSSGKSSEMVRSANQALAHVGGLLDAADALHNGSYPALNWIGNKYTEQTGGGAPTSFMLNAHAAADELGKMWKGSGLSDAEIHAWEDNLSPNMSPEQQRAAIGKLKDLLQGSLGALEEKRQAAIGPMAAEKAGPIIKPAGQAVLARMDKWLSQNSSAGSAPSTTKTGVKWSIE